MHLADLHAGNAEPCQGCREGRDRPGQRRWVPGGVLLQHLCSDPNHARDQRDQEERRRAGAAGDGCPSGDRDEVSSSVVVAVDPNGNVFEK